MIYLLTFWECLISIIFLGIGTLIFRMIAKEYEWDTSYKRAFIVVFLCTITSYLLFIIPILFAGVLSTLGLLNNLSFYVWISIYIIIFVLTLYTGILFIKRFYGCEFRESFSMLRSYLFYNIIISIPLFPFILGILSINP